MVASRKGVLIGGAVAMLWLWGSVAMAAGDIAAGRAKAAMCMSCHGAQGISAVPTYPNLAGQKEAYLVKAMHEFKDGTRKNATMSAMVAALSDKDMDNLAAYFSSLKSASCK